MTLHMTHVEFGFFVISIVVLVVSVFSLRDCMLDQSALAMHGQNGALKIIADANSRQEWFKIAIGVVMLLASGAALILEPPPPSYQNQPQDAVFTVAWICVGLLMILATTLDRMVRRSLIRRAVENLKRRASDHADASGVSPS